MLKVHRAARRTGGQRPTPVVRDAATGRRHAA
jgi:hypothetical protein